MTDQNNEPIKIKMVYLGQRIVTGKRTYAWMELNGDGNHEIGYYKKILQRTSIGSVYVFHKNRNEELYIAGEYAPRYTGQFEDQKQIMIWAAKDEETKQYFLQKKNAAKQPLDPLLKEIRLVARNLNAAERRALFSSIAEEIFNF